MTQEQVDRLNDLLFDAVELVLDLVPSQYRQKLRQISHARPPLKGAQLRDQLVAEIIADLEKENSERWEHALEQRALCPLCKRSSSAPYARGFTVPTGLKQHLTGSGNAHRCEVISLVRRYAAVQPR